ncbi:hypothetical protein E2636_06165 [Paenisporosarcina antarctica]|uniref:Uncharacterized protein n=1 Tax=Paenisporosarcina antarctica TaxID=417367 RepID=A0A4P6ZWI9_9BACL|nr:hypothetical protein E2636_06165 [Paenisporosarcina antarctica]
MREATFLIRELGGNWLVSPVPSKVASVEPKVDPIPLKVASVEPEVAPVEPKVVLVPSKVSKFKRH